MKKQNRLIIISTVYNKSKWVRFNVNSIKQQSYTNYTAVYGYDKSTDDTLEHLTNSIDSDSNFIIFENPNPANIEDAVLPFSEDISTMENKTYHKQLHYIFLKDIV